jgi:SAM-dependent methyltransferase
MPERIDRTEGRHLFGLNPQRYDTSRPDYPHWIFERLRAGGALHVDAAVLEIGAGSGRATRQLLTFGANPLTVIEPDVRFGPLLRSVMAKSAAETHLLACSFEDASLADDQFDLVAAATSFHWLEPLPALRSIRRLLKAGGTVALFWNVLADLDRPDAFHDATQALLSPLAVSPSGAPGTLPFALDRQAREADFSAAGFDAIEHHQSKSTFVIDTAGVGRLYEGFSHIQRLDAAARTMLLDRLMHIAETQFNGRVERYVTSCLYTARRT